MTHFMTLYQYELKKICSRKIVWITALLTSALMLILVLSVLFSRYYVDGVPVDTHYHMDQADREYQMRLDGRPIDQELLSEIRQGYDRLSTSVGRYTLTEEYEIYARPYSAISNYVRAVTGMTIQEFLKWRADEQDMYTKARYALEQEWRDSLLTEGEKVWWRAQAEAAERPVIFRYKEGWWELLNEMQTLGIVALVAVAVCLAGLYPEEHVKKTDQLILSSKYGRQTIYWAKFWAGVTLSAGLPILLSGVTFLAAFALYGADGFSADFRLIQTRYCYPLSVGEAVLISYGIVLIASLVTGVFVMMMSELLHNSLATLSLAVGMVILSMYVDMSEQNRVLSQMWSYLPGEYVAPWIIFSPRTVPLFGRYILSWQVVPVVYALFGVIFALVGRRQFVKYQVSGR